MFKPIFIYILATYLKLVCGARSCEVERRPRNLEVPIFSLTHTFGASTGVASRKQNQEGLV